MPNSSGPGDEGKNTLEWTGKAKIRLFPIAKSPAASFGRTLRPFDNACDLAIQPVKAPLQVREGWILQNNSEPAVTQEAALKSPEAKNKSHSLPI